MVIIKASLGNRIIHFMLKSKQRTDHTRQLACSHTCVQTRTYTPTACRPRCSLLCARRWVKKSCCCDSLMLMAGKSARCLCIFILTEQGQVYTACIEPFFPHVAGIHALMRVQSSRIQSTCWEQEGKALTGTCSNAYLHF